MKINGSPEPAGAGRAAADTSQTKPRSRFSDVLKDEKQRTEAPGKDGGKRETVEPEEPGKHEPLVVSDAAGDAAAVAPALVPIPFRDVAPVDAGHAMASQSEVLLASLVQEIAVEVPPGGGSSVDIQFDSRTLEGLRVRVQKTGDSVDVRFSTSSEAVSRLLTANANSLAEALVQRGYVAPAVSVQRAQGPTAPRAGDSRRGRRDRDNRGGNDQGGRQKRG